jgi:hypothetical protein
MGSMGGFQRFMEQFKAPPSGGGASALPADFDGLAITPPWHIRHARILIAGVAVLATVGLAYFSYQVWRSTRDPQIVVTRGTAASPVAAHPVPAVAPAEPVIPKPVIAAPTPKPVIATPAPKPVIAAPAQLPASTTPSASVRQPAAAGVPSSGPRRARVTHTEPEEAAPAAAATAAVPATDPAPSGCAPGVVALGLCGSVATKAGK